MGGRFESDRGNFDSRLVLWKVRTWVGKYIQQLGFNITNLRDIVQ